MRCLSALLSLLIVGVASAAAPISEPTDPRQLERLERRVDKITELSLQLDGLRQENRKLRGDIERLNHTIEQLKRKQRDIYLDIDQRLSAMRAAAAKVQPTVQPAQRMVPAPENAAPPTPNPAQPTPQNLQQIKDDYAAAYDLLSPTQRRYQEAIQAFNAFLQKYPSSALAGNAQYWLGEAHYVSQANDAALQAFEKVISHYPQSSKVPGALYKIGRIHQVKGDLNAALTVLQRIVQDYPDSPAANLARERLAELN